MGDREIEGGLGPCDQCRSGGGRRGGGRDGLPKELECVLSGTSCIFSM